MVVRGTKTKKELIKKNLSNPFCLVPLPPPPLMYECTTYEDSSLIMCLLCDNIIKERTRTKK